MRKISINKIVDSGAGQISSFVSIDGNEEIVKMTFSENVSSYISTDRADSLIMGLIMFAIKKGLDIVSHIPISETLYYKLVHHFIPGICGNNLHQPSITADIVDDIKLDESQGIVATGISCGVDSLYSVMEHSINVTDSFKLNHLVFLDAGAHHFGSSDKWDILYNGRRENAIKFSQETGLPLIEITTNLPLIIEKYSDYDHVEHHTYMMLSCLLMLQQKVRKYYYSGGYPYSDFDCCLRENDVLACAHYDLFTLWTASNSSIEFFSTGGSLNRLEKVKALKNFSMAEKYLNVCVTSVKNCGECFKCKRTLLELDAAGLVGRYGAVFDVDNYRRHRLKRIQEGFRGAIKGDQLLGEMMPFYHDNISSTQRMVQRIRIMCGRIISILRRR